MDINIHDIKYNNYIYKSLNTINNNNKILKLIYYCFNNVKINYLKKLEKKIIDKINKINKINNIDKLNKYVNIDEKIVNIICNWMDDIKYTDYVKYKLSDKAYIELKVNESVNIIKNDKSLNNCTYIDIGSGDCTLSYYIGNKLNMSIIPIDIDTNIDWDCGYNNNNNNCLPRKILYDGMNLKDIKEKIIHKFPYEYKNGKVLIRLCSYNHSIHHFNNIYNIKKNIKQTSNILMANGYIIFREHNISSYIDYTYLNLQHIFLFIKCNYKKNKNFSNFISSYNNYIDYFTPNYIDENFLINECYKNNLILIHKEKRKIPEPTNERTLLNNGINPYEDISKTYIYIFKKLFI